MAFAIVPAMQGFTHHPAYLDRTKQHQLLKDLKSVLKQAPLYTPTMPRTGKPFSVSETNCGPLGWVSDKQGYRYQPAHPFTGKPWPAMPPLLLEIWHHVAAYDHPPEAALINYYTPDARMSLHQDSNELDFDAPVVSVSLGQSATFRLGGQERASPTRSFPLHAGDVMVMGGKARMCFHGVDRILKSPPPDLFETDPLPVEDMQRLTGLGPGRLNITLRRVNKPENS